MNNLCRFPRNYTAIWTILCRFDSIFTVMSVRLHAVTLHTFLFMASWCHLPQSGPAPGAEGKGGVEPSLADWSWNWRWICQLKLELTLNLPTEIEFEAKTEGYVMITTKLVRFLPTFSGPRPLYEGRRKVWHLLIPDLTLSKYSRCTHLSSLMRSVCVLLYIVFFCTNIMNLMKPKTSTIPEKMTTSRW